MAYTAFGQRHKGDWRASETKIANSGCNLKSLQQLLGHTDIKTTIGYVEINIDDLRTIQSIL
jgi:site-specific recombinase XerD